MPILEEELRAAIRSDSAVNALVSGIHAVVPQNAALPYVFYMSSTTPDENSYTLDGPGLLRSVVTLACIGSTYSQAYAVARALRSLLENRRGELTATQDVENIKFELLRDEGQQEEPPGYRFDLDLEIVHK